MSKTVRRKNRKISVNSWVLWDSNSNVPYVKDSKEGKEALAEYYSDNGYGDLWYKRYPYDKYLERRKNRRKCDAALYRFLLDKDEDCVLPTCKHDWLA